MFGDTSLKNNVYFLYSGLFCYQVFQSFFWLKIMCFFVTFSFRGEYILLYLLISYQPKIILILKCMKGNQVEFSIVYSFDSYWLYIADAALWCIHAIQHLCQGLKSWLWATPTIWVAGMFHNVCIYLAFYLSCVLPWSPKKLYYLSFCIVWNKVPYPLTWKKVS